jgi:lysophospholipase L1-like esterase
MKSMKKLLNLAGVMLLANALAGHCQADAPPVRIMPLGDSITQGCCSGTSSEGGYRNRLHTLLSGAGYTVDFVGTETDSNNPSLPDRDHQGMAGYQIDAIRSVIGLSMKAVAQPDLILVHVGTNDFTSGAGVAVVQNRLINLINDLSTLRPHARILVASPIIRTDAAPLETAQNSFALALPQIVSDQAALGRKVHYVDLHSALDPGDLNDGVHPNPGGYDKMADAWFAAIAGVITPLGTADAPAIADVDSRGDLEHLTITFSKPLADSAAAPANFNISGGVAVLGAQLDPVSKRVITLTTSAQAPGMLHTLSVSNVRDRTPQENLIAPQSTRTFTSRGVVDGSFEANAQGWTSSGNYLVANSSLPATNGSKLIVFNGSQTTPNGTISQTIATVPGQTYRLDFDMGVYDSGNNTQSLEITVSGNSTLLSRTESVSGNGSAGTRWTSRSLEFVSDSTSTTVSFHDVSPVTNNVDLLLDDVRLNSGGTPTLTVNSTPANGVSVTVSPIDNGSNGDGVTEFTRTYNEGDTVNLTAPANLGTKTFDKWQKNGANHSTSAATSVTMDANHTMTAVYRVLVNGSFELGSPGDIGTLDGWNVTGNPFGYTSHPTSYVPTEGNRFALFNAGGDVFNGIITQTFPTVVGQTYTLSLDQGITGTPGKQQRILISVDGATNRLGQFSDITSTGAPALGCRLATRSRRTAPRPRSRSWTVPSLSPQVRRRLPTS